MHPHPLLIVGRDQRNLGWGVGVGVGGLARLRGQGPAPLGFERQDKQGSGYK